MRHTRATARMLLNCCPLYYTLYAMIAKVGINAENELCVLVAQLMVLEKYLMRTYVFIINDKGSPLPATIIIKLLCLYERRDPRDCQQIVNSLK